MFLSDLSNNGFELADEDEESLELSDFEFAMTESGRRCRSNRDCPNRNTFCNQRRRRCERRNYGCSRDRDCPKRNDVCRNNICVRKNNQRSCRRNGDCRNGQRCNQSGRCVSDKSRKPRSGKRCNYNSSTRNRREQCPGNQICGRNNRCQRRNMDFEE